MDYRKTKLRQEWELLENKSWMILKEIADEIGSNLGKRINWRFFKGLDPSNPRHRLYLDSLKTK